MARRSDHTRKELKELILEKSAALIEEDGYEGLSARRIAAEIGYAPGTIYNLFRSMDDICLHLNALTMDALYDVLSAPVCNNPRKSPVKNMEAMAAQYMAFARANRSRWLMLFHYRLKGGAPAPAWYRKKTDRLFEPLETLLAPLFSRSRARQRVLAARVLWSSVHGLCFLQETGKIPPIGGKADADAMASFLIGTFVAGIGKTH